MNPFEGRECECVSGGAENGEGVSVSFDAPGPLYFWQLGGPGHLLALPCLYTYKR